MNAKEFDSIISGLEVLGDILDKATPKKVKEMQDHYFSETYEYNYTSGRCPNCDQGVSCDEYYEPKYCVECGQRLDWEEV